jgi:hypothetical protein
MSTVFDVDSIVIEEEGEVPVTVLLETPTVTDDVTGFEVVEIEVPGLQGPPGDQMIYPQPTSPAIEYGWDEDDAGKIWIQVSI